MKKKWNRHKTQRAHRRALKRAAIITMAGAAVIIGAYSLKVYDFRIKYTQTADYMKGNEENVTKGVVTYEEATNSNHTTAAVRSSYKRLDVECVLQNPELPTGCEITSLTEVLNYLGYGIDKETLARNYLDMRDTVTQGCFVEYFWGSPWKTTGSGCFAPAIANAANSFLKSQNSSYSAYIMSYSPVEDLFTELSLGHPVIVWTSYNYNDPEVKYNDVTLDDGTVFTWPRNEHCVALAGYDIDKGVVTLADPTYGIVERSMEEFVTYYQKYYYQAVVVR